MADVSGRPLSLFAALCFIISNYGKLENKRIETTAAEFYKLEDITEAKTLLVEVLGKLQLENASRISKRRNGDNRRLQELDDILKVLSFLDETSCLDNLPRYVTDDYKRTPTARLEAGDMFLFLTKRVYTRLRITRRQT